MFPFVLAADTASVIQGLLTVGAIGGAIIWLLERRATKDATEGVERSILRAGTPSHRLSNLVLYAEPRLAVLHWSQSGDAVQRLSGEVDIKELTPDVAATVETAGNVSVTRGRNLAAKATGGLLIPGGVFIFGNARETTHDQRELYLIVEANDWAVTSPIDPNFGQAAREMAQAINVRVKALTPAKPERAADGVLEQLERLVRLREDGALTNEEFERQKQYVLADSP